MLAYGAETGVLSKSNADVLRVFGRKVLRANFETVYEH